VGLGRNAAPKAANTRARRQHPIDDYVLDFYCPSAKLAVELDGGGHNIRQAKFAIERGQNSWLGVKSLCCDSRIIKFTRELDSVLQAIWFALDQRQLNNPSPSSSPFGKGRGELQVPSAR
jgi:Uncharacterized protein conserved in bacteria